MQAEAVLAGPALRLRLLELLVANYDTMDGSDVVATAREAYAFVVGEEETATAGLSIRIPELSTEAVAAQMRCRCAAPVLPEPESPDAEAEPEPIEPAPATGSKKFWTDDRLADLERHIAAGLVYDDIAKHFDVTTAAIRAQASIRGFSKTYPRDRAGLPLYESYPLTSPWPKSAPKEAEPKSERDRLIAEHIATKGVLRAVDFGADQPAVDVLRRYAVSVVGSRNPRAPWSVNGADRTTNALWERANAELRSRGLPTIRRVAKAP